MSSEEDLKNLFEIALGKLDAYRLASRLDLVIELVYFNSHISNLNENLSSSVGDSICLLPACISLDFSFK